MRWTGSNFCRPRRRWQRSQTWTLSLLWNVIRKTVSQADIPQAQAMLDKLPETFEKFAGVSWQKVLDSLGGEYGFVITLDDSKMIPVPLPTSEPLEVPEPAIMIVIKVKDNTIYDRVAQVLKQHEQQVVTVDKPDLKMLTMPVPLPLPIQLRPSIATSGGYLFIATTDALIQQALAVKEGKTPGLNSTDEFKKLARGIPGEGNQFTFMSQRFGLTMRESAATGHGHELEDPPRSKAMARIHDAAPEGRVYIFREWQHGSRLAHGRQWQPATRRRHRSRRRHAARRHGGVASAIAIPNFIKARETAQRNACINNLRQIDAAKQQWALENGKKDGDVPTRSDLAPYLRGGFPELPGWRPVYDRSHRPGTHLQHPRPHPEPLRVNSFLRQVDRVEQRFQAGQRGFLLRIQHLPQVIDGVGDGAHRLRERGAAGVGVAAALKVLRHFQRLAVSAAEAGDDEVVGRGGTA